MFELLYFDWNGTRDELETYLKNLKEVCGKHGITYRGCYGPPQDRYHYTIFLENTKLPPANPDYNSFNPVWMESGMKPPQMGHIVFKYYVNMGI